LANQSSLVTAQEKTTVQKKGKLKKRKAFHAPTAKNFRRGERGERKKEIVKKIGSEGR